MARTVAEAAPRSRAVLSGAVRSLAVRRRSVLAGTRRVASHRAGTGAWLEVELDDGTGVVALRWMGRDARPRRGGRGQVDGGGHGARRPRPAGPHQPALPFRSLLQQLVADARAGSAAGGRPRPACAAAGGRRPAGSGPRRRRPSPTPRAGSSGGCRPCRRGGPGRPGGRTRAPVRSSGWPSRRAMWWTRSTSIRPTASSVGCVRRRAGPPGAGPPAAGPRARPCRTAWSRSRRPRRRGPPPCAPRCRPPTGRSRGPGVHWRMRRQTSIPSMSGSPRSSTTTSGVVSDTWVTPSAPVRATTTS